MSIICTPRVFFCPLPTSPELPHQSSVHSIIQEKHGLSFCNVASNITLNAVTNIFRLLSNQYLFRYFQRWEKMEEGITVAQKFCMVPCTLVKIIPWSSPTQRYLQASLQPVRIQVFPAMRENGRGLHSGAKILYGPLYTSEGNSKVVTNTVRANFRFLSNQYIFRYFQRWEKPEEGFTVGWKLFMVSYTLKVIPWSSPIKKQDFCPKVIMDARFTSVDSFRRKIHQQHNSKSV